MKIYKLASINVTVADFEPPMSRETIYDLSNYLSNFIRYKTDFINQLTDFEKAYWNKNGVAGSDFITIDGLDMDSPVGTINVYLASLPERMQSILQKYLSNILSNEGFKFHLKGIDDSKMFKSKVMRIQIDHNPFTNQKTDLPPELNMANMNAEIVLGKILGYDLSEGHLEIPVFDITNKLNNVTDQSIEQNERVTNRDWAPGKVQIISPGYSKDKIKYILNKLKEIAQWAINHDYKRLDIS